MCININIHSIFPYLVIILPSVIKGSTSCNILSSPDSPTVDLWPIVNWAQNKGHSRNIHVYTLLINHKYKISERRGKYKSMNVHGKVICVAIMYMPINSWSAS